MNGAAVFALAVFLIALWAQGTALVGVFYDDGIYVTGAKALAQGAGYYNIHLPVPFPIIHYPILYPLLLSAMWRVWPEFPANVALFQLATAGLLSGAAWVVAAHSRRVRLNSKARIVAMALGFSAFPLLNIVQLQLSEPLFLLLIAGSVAVADRDDAGMGAAVAAGLLAGLAMLTKSVALCAVLGVPAALWLRRRRAAALVTFGVASLVALPWAAWVVVHAPGVDPRLANYTTYFAEVRQAGFAAVLSGLRLRSYLPLPLLTLPHGPVWVATPLSALLLVALVWGGISIARRAPALIATLALYLLIVSLWPFPPHRFIWIVLPWLGLLVSAGCAAAWRYGPAPRALVAVLLASMAYGYVPRETVSLAKRRFGDTSDAISASFRLLIAPVAAETPADAVIASEDEALIYLYTGRRSVPSHLFRWSGLGTEELPEGERLQYWCEFGVTHLAVTAPGDPASKLVARDLQGARPLFTPLFQVTNGPGLYRLSCPR